MFFIGVYVKKIIVIKGKKVEIHEIPTNPKILENMVEGKSYIPEEERVYVRGREWSIG